MSIIDWDALKRDGMPAVHAALRALEAFAESNARETAQDLKALYAQTVRLTDRSDYLEARRRDDRKIREEIDGRLRVVEEQVANMATALTELTHDTQTDLRILQERMDAPSDPFIPVNPPCAMCHREPAITGQRLCAECFDDVQAGIEDAGLAGMRVRRPVRHTYPRKGRGDGIGTYCERCGTVILSNAGEYTLAACEYCGHNHLAAITQFRDDRDAMGLFRIPQGAVRVAMSDNGHD